METGKIKLALSAGVLALSMALAGCGGGGSSTAGAGDPPSPPPPTPYAVAVDAIEDATTPEAVQKAVDDAKDEVSGTQADELQDLADKRIADLAEMGRIATQTQELMDALEKVNTSDLSTEESIEAARMAIAELQEAIGKAGDIDDTSMYETAATDAQQRVDLKVAENAIAAARADVAALTAESDNAAIMAAQDKINAATTAVEAIPDDQKASHTAQIVVIQTSHDTAEQRVALVGQINALLAQLDIDDSADIRDTIQGLQNRLAELQKDVNDAAEEERKETAATDLANAKALFAAAVAGSGRWDQTQPASATFSPKYGELTAIGGVLPFTRMVDGEALGKSGEPLNTVGKWSGTMVSETDTANASLPADTVVVYSNIGPDVETDFEDAYPSLNNTALVLPANAPKIAGADFGTNNVRKEHSNGASVRGTFDGAPGTYTCGDSGDCYSQVGPDDKGIQLTGPWTFADDPGATVQVADATYSYFGWWLEKTEVSDTLTFNVHTFHNGTTGNAVSDISTLNLTGTAKYMGPAVGKYAMVHDDGDEPSHTGGHFTATTDLEVDFSASARITGDIKDFVGGGTDWTVKLDSDPNADGDATDATAVWHIGLNKGGIANTIFSSTFRDVSKGEPTTLTGAWETRFNPEAGSVTGHMIGAFGTTKQ